MLTSRKKTLQTRFFVFSLFISLCVMALTLGVTYYASFRTIENITTKYLNTYIGYADNTLTERLNSAKLLAHAIAIDTEIVQRAVSGKTIEASYDWYIEQKVLKSYLDGMVVDKPYVNKIAVVLNNGRIYQSGSGLLVLRDFRTPWFQNALGASKLQISYLTDTKGAMRITRPVMSGKAIVGTVFIEISIDTLCEAYRLRPLENVTLLLFAEQEELFYVQGEHTELASLEHIGSRETGYIRLMGSEYFVVRYPSAGGGLVTLGFIKRDNVVKSALELGGQVWWIALAALMLAAGASRLFSRFLFKNLNILMDGMQAVHRGELTKRVNVVTSDEISEAADVFNSMMNRLQELMLDIRAQEAAKREAEQNVLAAQIKPHFVYNAISAMQYVAGMRGQTDIERAAGALSDLMRSVLGNRDEWITLWEERTYIESYIVLERMKVQSGFALTWEVEEEMWGLRIPKLMLQPLVENAVIHGITLKEDGEIKIQGRREKGKIALRVIDNGVGMDEKQVAQVMARAQAESSAFRSVGVPNVMERVSLCYKGSASFEIFSTPGAFTCVEILLPENAMEEDAYAGSSGAGG